MLQKIWFKNKIFIYIGTADIEYLFKKLICVYKSKNGNFCFWAEWNWPCVNSVPTSTSTTDLLLYVLIDTAVCSDV